ncbi:hypothetical protein HAX54_001004 [Datura stramonium]|uniref:Secreted protein n=1 Tax=Datura stramonium TaxID=4076 RepID=A0ABS8T3R7_DATST|nr:hypothetical protein [Datura stramonium]
MRYSYRLLTGFGSRCSGTWSAVVSHHGVASTAHARRRLEGGMHVSVIEKWGGWSRGVAQEASPSHPTPRGACELVVPLP